MTTGAESWTVVGDDLLPIAEIDRFLSYCTAVGKSPTTVETYAYALATLFRFLDQRKRDWRELTLEQAARFVESPVVRRTTDQMQLSPATTETKSTAECGLLDATSSENVASIRRMTVV